MNVAVTSALSGYASRDERTELTVLCLAQGSGDSFTKKRDAALALADEVEDALVADRTLGGLVDVAYVENISVSEGVVERDRGCGVEVRVVCEGSAS